MQDPELGLGGKLHPLRSVSRQLDHIDDNDDDWGLQEVRGSHLINIDTTDTGDLIGTVKTDSSAQDTVSQVGGKLDAIDGEYSTHV